MESTIAIDIAADPDTVFAAAAGVEGWPRFLPHYRWVRKLSTTPTGRVVEMAAKRDFYPVKWVSALETDATTRRMRFTHLGGPARGMEVEWRIDPTPQGTHVVIWHRFNPPIPLAGPLFADLIVGRLFIHNIAGKTLRHLKAAVESGRIPTATPSLATQRDLS